MSWGGISPARAVANCLPVVGVVLTAANGISFFRDMSQWRLTIDGITRANTTAKFGLVGSLLTLAGVIALIALGVLTLGPFVLFPPLTTTVTYWILGLVNSAVTCNVIILWRTRKLIGD